MIVEDTQRTRALLNGPVAVTGRGSAVEDGTGRGIHLDDSAICVVHHHAVHHGVERGLDLRGALGQLTLQAPLGGHVARDSDGADDCAPRVAEWGRAHLHHTILS